MRWRVYSSGSFLGFAHAGTDLLALDRARLLYDQRPLQVVTQAAWQTFSATARAIFEKGEAARPEKPRDAQGSIVTVCKKCRKPVPQTPPRGKRTGRPRRIHDECLSPGQRRWRYDPRRHQNQQRYRQERQKENAA